MNTVTSNGSEAGNEAACIYNRLISEEKKLTQEWIDMLRDRGVKAAHRDDGWVDRKRNSVTFCYPFFCDSPTVGDLIALGDFKEYRLVRITAEDRRMMYKFPRWYFEAV